MTDPQVGELIFSGQPPIVTSHTPTSSATNVAISSTITATFSESVYLTPSGFRVTYGPGNVVPGGLTSTGAVWTFTPSIDLIPSTVYTVTVSGAVNGSNTPQESATVWTFTTAAPVVITWGNTLVQETALPGAPQSEWGITGAGSQAVQGFTRRFSVNAGNIVDFAVHSDKCTVVDIYRIGGYDTGWRKVGSVVNNPINQPEPQIIAGANGGNTCAGWFNTAAWTVPSAAWSGLYVGIPRIPGGASWIPFVVRNDGRNAQVVLKTSETTWALAYNHYGNTASPFGGLSLNGDTRAVAVSLDRPIVTRQTSPHAYWLNSEAPLIRFLEKQGVDYKMVASVDLESNMSSVGSTRVLISSGSDSYWSQGLRDGILAFQAAGGHLMFMTGGAAFWRVRFGGSMRTMWCYKDASDPVSWTGTWRDGSWGGNKSENQLTGTLFRMSETYDKNALINASVFGDSPIWRGTVLAHGTSVGLSRIIGPQADTASPTGSYDYSVQVAGTVLNINGAYVSDSGYTSNNDGNLYWGIVLQRNGTGGVVVGFGTAQWQWALDGVHDRDTTTADVTAQQATINLLTDMGVSVLTPSSGVKILQPVPWDDYGLTAVDDTPIAPSTYGLMISDGTQWYPISTDDGEDGSGSKNPVLIDFPAPSKTWIIDVGYLPSITVVDSAGSVVEPGSIDYEGTTVTLEFSAPFSGTAYCFA